MRRLSTLTILVMIGAFAFSSASAQVDIGLKGVGFKVGVVGPDNVDATVGFGFFADLGTFVPQVALEAYADFWSQSETFAGAKSSARDIVFGSRVKYMFPVTAPKISPYAGAGLGIHFVSVEATSPAIDLGGGLIIPAFTFEDTTTKIGLDLGGGLNVNVHPKADVLGEVWYGIVSDVSQWSARVGLLYKLGM